MYEAKLAGLSLGVEVYTVLGTVLVSVLSFGVVVAHYASGAR